MKPLEQHEQFEIEVLHFLNSRKLLNHLVFGGGTMLRLCYDMNRYSVDMDFYFRKKVYQEQHFEKLIQRLGKRYGITDSQNKFKTMLIELTHVQYPRRLKIEINKERIYTHFRQAIAFSPHSTHQVFVNVIPLEQMINNKIEALLERKEIRDAFDIEFLIKRGVKFSTNKETIEDMVRVIRKFSKNDFYVKLGSLLPADVREYYKQNRFSVLEDNLNQVLSSGHQ